MPRPAAVLLLFGAAFASGGGDVDDDSAKTILPECKEDLGRFCGSYAGDVYYAQVCDSCVDRVDQTLKAQCTHRDETIFCGTGPPVRPGPVSAGCRHERTIWCRPAKSTAATTARSGSATLA
jgi:hypothetical protein